MNQIQQQQQVQNRTSRGYSQPKYDNDDIVNLAFNDARGSATQFSLQDKNKNFLRAVELNRIVYESNILTFVSQPELKVLIEKINRIISQTDRPWFPRIHKNEWQEPHKQELDLYKKYPPGFIYEDHLSFYLVGFSRAFEVQHDPRSTRATVKLAADNLKHLRAIMAQFIQNDLMLLGRLQSTVTNLNANVKEKSLSPQSRQVLTQPVNRSRKAPTLAEGLLSQIQASNSKQKAQLTADEYDIGFNTGLRVNRYVYSVDVKRDVKVHSNLPTIFKGVQDVIKEMKDPFEPRVRYGEWQPIEGDDEKALYPPGFIHEDVIDFVLDLMQVAYMAKYGQHYDSKVDPKANSQTKLLGGKIYKDGLHLVQPILFKDPALLMRMGNDLGTMKKLQQSGKLGGGGRQSTQSSPRRHESSQQTSPTLKSSQKAYIKSKPDLTIMQTTSPTRRQSQVITQQNSGSLKSRKSVAFQDNLSPIVVRKQQSNSNLPSYGGLARTRTFSQDLQSPGQASSIQSLTGMSPQVDKTVKTYVQNALNKIIPAQSKAIKDYNRSLAEEVKKMKYAYDEEVSVMKMFKSQFEGQVSSLHDFKTQFRQQLQDKQRQINTLQKRTQDLERAIEINSDNKSKSIHIYPAQNNDTKPKMVHLDSIQKVDSNLDYKFNQLQKQFDVRISETEKELTALMKSSVIKLMTFEKIQEQQNTEIVDLKLKVRATANADGSGAGNDQIFALRNELKTIRDQATNLNINGLSQTFGDQEKTLKSVQEDHERLQLENLRLMLHFKTEIRDFSTTFDGLIAALNQQESSPADSKRLINSTRQVLAANSLRVREEISSLQRVIESFSLGQGSNVMFSQIFDNNSQQVIQKLTGEVSALRKERESLRDNAIKEISQAKTEHIDKEQIMNWNGKLAKFKEKVERQLEFQQIQTQQSIQNAVKDAVKWDTISKLQREFSDKIDPVREAIKDLRQNTEMTLIEQKSEIKTVLSSVDKKIETGNKSLEEQYTQVFQWIKELREQMKHRIEESIVLQNNPTSRDTSNLNSLQPKSSMQLRSDYDQLNEFKPAEITTSSNLYVLEQAAEVRSAIRELENRYESINQVTTELLQRLNSDPRIEKLSQQQNDLSLVFEILNNKVTPYLKYHEESAFDIRYLLETSPEVQDPSLGNSILGLKMTGLAKVARSINLMSDQSVKEIIHSYRAVELPLRDDKQISRYENANPRVQAILTVVDVFQKLVDRLNTESQQPTGQKLTLTLSQILNVAQLTELLTKNNQQSWISLTKSRLMQIILILASYLATDLAFKYKYSSGLITKTIMRILTHLTLQQEGRLQLMNAASQQSAIALQNLISLMKMEWGKDLDPVDKVEIVANGFKVLRQMAHGADSVQRLVQAFPGLLIDVSDMIMQNVEQPSIMRHVRSLLFNYRSVTSLPEHLENLIRGQEQEPQIEIVMQNILKKSDPPNLLLSSPVAQAPTYAQITEPQKTELLKTELLKTERILDSVRSRSEKQLPKVINQHSAKLVKQPDQIDLAPTQVSIPDPAIKVSFKQFMHQKNNSQIFTAVSSPFTTRRTSTENIRESNFNSNNQNSSTQVQQPYIPLKQQSMMNTERSTRRSSASLNKLQDRGHLPQIRTDQRQRAPNNIEILQQQSQIRNKQTKN